MADDQGWGDVAYNGHPRIKTPTLDAMAKSALRFDRFYSAAPVCSPTRGSVMTGRHPNRFGCFQWGHHLRTQEVTVAEALKQAGYTTGHFGKWHLGEVTADGPASPGNSGFDEWFSSPNFYENSPLMSHNGKVVRTEGEGSKVTMDAALEFIERARDAKKPFLAVVWFGSPHTPHIAIPEDRKLYSDLSKREQNYLGEITAMDRAMGTLRKRLREMNIADNTVVWYTSDNGSRKPGSTGGLRGRKGTLWEGGIRVPAIIEWPARIKSPRRIAAPCGTVDIFPTVLELAGITKPASKHPLDGTTLMPIINGKDTVDRKLPLGFWVYPERGRPVRSTQILQALEKRQQANVKTPKTASIGPSKISRKYDESSFPGNAALIDGRYKLHHRGPRNGKKTYQLYDLKTDPQEMHDIAEKHPDVVKRMQSALADWQKSVVRSLNGKDYAK